MVPPHVAVPEKLIVTLPLLVLIPERVKPVVPKSIGQLAKSEFNEEAEVVMEIDGLAWVLEIVDVEAITGAVAFAVVIPTNEIIEVNKKVTAAVETIFFNMKCPLIAMGLLNATSANFKLLSEMGFLY